jgi:hypothetical protein
MIALSRRGVANGSRWIAGAVPPDPENGGQHSLGEKLKGPYLDAWVRQSPTEDVGKGRCPSRFVE